MLLVDSASVTFSGLIRRLNRRRLGKQTQKHLAPLPSLQQGIWGAASLYVTGVSHNLDESLTLMLQAIERNEDKKLNLLL